MKEKEAADFFMDRVQGSVPKTERAKLRIAFKQQFKRRIGKEVSKVDLVAFARVYRKGKFSGYFQDYPMPPTTCNIHLEGFAVVASGFGFAIPDSMEECVRELGQALQKNAELERQLAYFQPLAEEYLEKKEQRGINGGKRYK